METLITTALQEVPNLVVLVAVVALFLRHQVGISSDWGSVIKSINERSNDTASDVAKVLERNTEITEELMTALGHNSAVLGRVDDVLRRFEKEKNDA